MPRRPSSTRLGSKEEDAALVVPRAWSMLLGEFLARGLFLPLARHRMPDSSARILAIPASMRYPMD